MKSIGRFLGIATGLCLIVPGLAYAAPTLGFADLAIGKTASMNVVGVGNVFSFQLSVTNLGPDTASNAIVSDVLPPGLQYLSSSGSYNSKTGQWSFNPGAAGTISNLVINVMANNPGTFTNTATIISSSPTDTNAANNTASASVTVTNPILPQADLQISQSVSPSVVNTNGQVSFYITLQNNGPGSATNIIVQVNPPAGLSLVYSNVYPGTMFNAGTGAWSIPSLNNGATVNLQLNMTTSSAGNYTNVAFVASSGNPDPNLLNNTNNAVAIFVAGNATDLAVSVSANTNMVPANSAVVLTCYVFNLGPNPATNVAATFTYPPGMTISGVLVDTANFNTNTGIFQVGSLNNGQVATLKVQFTPTNAGVFTINFQISSSSLADPVVTNNSASVTVTGLVSYAISGGIQSCSGAVTNIPVILSATNMSNLSIKTDSNGNFLFNGLFPGTYTVTPSSSSYSYLPTNMIVTIVNTNVTLTNFTALQRFITGTVLQGGAGGQPVAGVTLLLGGALSQTNLTDTNGVFVFSSLNAGTYTVTPQTNSFPGMQFAPTNATVILGSLTNCPGAANFVTTNNIIVLRALEVIQVIQDWSNSVVLVANKATLVRAHLQLYGTNTTPILVEGARLYAQNAGGSASWPPDDGRITVTTTNCAAPEIRSNINMSLYFTVRNAYKTGQDTFRFSWTNGVVFNAEPGDVSGDPASNGQVRVSFNVMPPLGVRFIRVAMTNGLMTNITATATNIVAITNLPTASQINEEKRRLVSIYPISQITNLTVGYIFWQASMSPSWEDETAFLRTLNAARLTSSDTNGTTTNRIWYGVGPQGVVVRGASYVPSYVAEGCISTNAQNYQRYIAAHEIGHALGRPHAVRAAFGAGVCGVGSITGHCGECDPAGTPDFPMVNTLALGFMPALGPLVDDNQIIWGYDTYQEMVISPYYYYDLMSYCCAGTAGVDGFPDNSLGPWPWNSKYTYTNLYSAIQSRFSAAAVVVPPATEGLPEPSSPKPAVNGNNSQPYLLVRGQIDDFSGGVTFDPCYPVASALPVTPGPFTLVLLDTNAVVLYSLPFAPDVPEGEYGNQPTSDAFDLSVPIIPGAAAIEIYSNTLPVGQLVAATNSPFVQVLHPNGGEQFGDTDILANWTSSDTDGSPLVYLVQFSPDGGNSWDTLAIDWNQTNLDIPPDTLPATTNGLIRVIASDGFNTYTAQPAGPFTITNHLPAISILQPGAGALFYGDQTIVLEADAYDLDDGSLDGTNVLWTSSLDGPLGNGDLLPLETLNLHEGIHIVTATAIANSGLTNSASVQITVLRLPLPQLSSQLANNRQILLSWPASYTNYVLESTASLLPANWTTVTNVPVPADIIQAVTLNLSNTNQFFRLQMQ
jgi:uncharacterized repeat protein (TIGR01451 family)